MIWYQLGWPELAIQWLWWNPSIQPSVGAFKKSIFLSFGFFPPSNLSDTFTDSTGSFFMMQ
jgi:hypothetical protein